MNLRSKNTFNIGILLLGLGLLSLMGNMGIFRGMPDAFGTLLFVGGASFFGYTYNRNPGQWWALIPASVFAGLAAATVFDLLGGILFLTSIGLGFLAIYLLHPRQWWAVIPGGGFFSLAAAAAGDLLPRLDPGSLLFLGFAATFTALYRLPGDRKLWARYPAAGALVLALLTVLPGSTWLFPLLLISAGGLMLSQNPSPRVLVPAAPPVPATELHEKYAKPQEGSF